MSHLLTFMTLFDVFGPLIVDSSEKLVMFVRPGAFLLAILSSGASLIGFMLALVIAPSATIALKKALSYASSALLQCVIGAHEHVE